MPEFDPNRPADTPSVGGVPGGSLMASALSGGGIDTIFALCGGHILGLLDACHDEEIRIIDMRHEGAVTLAALGWSLATARTGVGTVTAGPGFGNAVTGMLDASLGNAPVVLLSGRTGINQQGRGAVMDIDQRAVLAPVVKATRTLRATERIPQVTAEALHLARSGRPGPVYVEMPQDVLMGTGAPPEVAWPTGFPDLARPRPASADVEAAIAALVGAERPVIVAGSGAFWSGAGDALAAFARATNIPVTTTSAARGLVPDSDPLCLGSLVHGGLAVPQADVVLIVGSAFNANLMYGRPPLFGEQQSIIQIDIDGDRLGGERLPHVAIAADAREALHALTDAWDGPAPARDAWLETARASAAFGVASWDHQVDSHDGERIHAGAAARVTAAFAASQGAHTFVADGGDALTWGLAYAQVEGPGRLLNTTTALGTLGVGLPFAVAAAAARPDEPVFAFIGDGTFGLTAMEFDTAVRHRLPVICVISNNTGWRDVSHEQDAWFGPGRRVASDLGDSRYDKIAEAFGGTGESVADLDDLEPALKRAMDAGEPAIIDVKTDPEVLSLLLQNMGTLNLM